MFYHYQRMLNVSDIMQPIRLVSSTKDSLFVEWSIRDMGLRYVRGYKLTYQAIGSTFKQDISILDQTKTSYDITTLHEDTDYNICVEIIFKDLAEGANSHECIRASTATDSLSVALGSTFGAFLALAIIILFVFVAKWQHTRKLRSQRAATAAPGDSLDSMVHVDGGDFELSEVSLHMTEDSGLKMDFGPTPTPTPTPQGHDSLRTSNGTLPRHKLLRGRSCDCDVEAVINHTGRGSEAMKLAGAVTVHEPPDTRRLREGYRNQANGCRSLSLDMYHDQKVAAAATTTTLPHPASQPHVNSSSLTPLPLPPPPGGSSDRPPDVRPKEKALMDLTHMYANKKLFEPAPGTGLRPNLSCNW